MSEMPFMKFFPADYLRDASILTLPAQGAWMRILCEVWNTSRQGILSYPIQILARVIGSDEKTTTQIIAEIGQCRVAEVDWWEEGSGATITCRRVVRDWKVAVETRADVSKKRSEAAHSRWSNPNASALQVQCKSNALQKLEARSQKPEHREEREPALFPLPRPLPGTKARGTLDELKAYAAEISFPESDGEACFHQWEGNGWTNNGKPVKGWKSTIKSWSMKGFLASQKAATAHGPHRATPLHDPPPAGHTRGADGRYYKNAS